MTISRGQMNRQLYMGGGIMNAVPREQYGFGSIFKGVKKAVKGVTGAVKDIASSDLGKAALAGAAIYYGGGGNLFGLQRAGMSGFGLGNLPGAGFFASGPSSKNFMTDTVISGKSPFSKLFSKIPGGGITAAIGGGSILAGLLTKAQMAEIDEVDPDERGDVVAEKLRQSLVRLGVSGEELERRVAEGVSEYTGYTSKAQGGRVNYAMGTEPTGLGSLAGTAAAGLDLDLMTIKATLNQVHSNNDDGEGGGIDAVMKFMEKNPEYKVRVLQNITGDQGDKIRVAPMENQSVNISDQIILKYENRAQGGRIGYQDAGPVLPPDPTQPVNPFAPKPTGPVLPNKEMAMSYGYEDAMSDTYSLFLQMKERKEIPIDMDFEEFLMEVVPEMSKKQTEGRGLAALGGRMNYALGDTASQNAMQAASVEGLPMRQNPKGVQELDLRDNGGFIPPVGIKEKEDDIPAMLSNNEFVFTADAVRGMGDGDVDLGAQRMYDQMKMLEAGGKV